MLPANMIHRSRSACCAPESGVAAGSSEAGRGVGRSSGEDCMLTPESTELRSPCGPRAAPSAWPVMRYSPSLRLIRSGAAAGSAIG